MKIAINQRYGGFSLSKIATTELLKYAPMDANYIHNGKWLLDRKIPRDNPLLIGIVERLGDLANDVCAKIVIIEIPDKAYWYIFEYDGYETLVWSMSEIIEVEG